MGVLSGKPSSWFPLKSSSQVPVYLDSDELQDTLVSYLKALLNRTTTKLRFTEEVQFILVFYFQRPSYGLSMLRNLSLPDAEKIIIGVKWRNLIGEYVSNCGQTGDHSTR
ncbi:hypothetical protein UPYG_G00011270 [Umbra pygmaea]|uniref:Uncharacterized protein n=1 Tax=Umbra pygmaea TaxID=75934 RepID=A0ABD0XIM0_UMBPY